MQSQQLGLFDDATLMKLLNKIHVHEAQLKLLEETMKNDNLLESRILSSLQPKVGREFAINELENQKLIILKNTREQLISLAVKEKETLLCQLNAEFNTKKQDLVTNSENPNNILAKLEQASSKQGRELNEKMNKKVEFHLQGSHESIKFAKVKSYIKKKKRKPNARQKKKKKTIYRSKQKDKKQEKIKAMVSKIKEENVVVNLSNQEIPDAVYLFLQKGLGFVSSQKVDNTRSQVRHYGVHLQA